MSEGEHSMNDNERERTGAENAGDSGESEEIRDEETALDIPEMAPDDGESEEEENADADATELKDQLLRALAETENVRRRAKKDVADAGRYGIANFARDMLSVSDNMARALESIPDGAREESEIVKALVEGVEMTARELATALERHGIKQVNPLGEKFDYNLHQAMFEAPATGQPDGTIIEVVQAGFVIGDRLLRPAMVGVAKAAPPPKDMDGDQSGDNGKAENLGSALDTSA
ncbi:MAG: nucleotide exchange factor GrpE [Rhodospirillaceae bacterium]|nr:nucleotide exchange factor GrpE [Rhodospirillaceae bacterium]MBT5676430.1 nucleotide exchange factor GrpE [Rhodospirillaceae bacterium]MBT7291360.1 nucleotide exchange factor GrpE [Rhodospirillaceae bacterium]